MNRTITINGGGHTLSYTEVINGLAYGSRHGIALVAEGVTINDLKVTLTEKAEWQGAYALHVYNAKNVTLKNFAGTGADAALLVNASAVNLTGSKLTVTGTLINDSEAYLKPRTRRSIRSKHTSNNN